MANEGRKHKQEVCKYMIINELSVYDPKKSGNLYFSSKRDCFLLTCTHDGTSNRNFVV